ncbi:41846_t:CDS:2, partial [Gigaspora margarita]
REIVSLARKFVIKNSEQYIIVASATKVNKKNSSDEFSAELVPLNTSHLIFNVTVIHDLNTIVTMVEATDIDYLRQEINYNTTKNPNQAIPQSLSNLNKIANEINASPEQKNKKNVANNLDTNFTFIPNENNESIFVKKEEKNLYTNSKPNKEIKNNQTSNKMYQNDNDNPKEKEKNETLTTNKK